MALGVQLPLAELVAGGAGPPTENKELTEGLRFDSK